MSVGDRLFWISFVVIIFALGIFVGFVLGLNA